MLRGVGSYLRIQNKFNNPRNLHKMIGIIRIYQDAYGPNMGARTFCQLSQYFGGVLITDNKKIHALEEFKSIRYDEAVANKAKFTKLIVYNTKPNMFGGVPAKHTAMAVQLILTVQDVYYYNCDPILHLPSDVADSHEAQVPGLRKAIYKLNQHGTILDRTNTDLTKFLAARIRLKPLPVVEKKYSACYFGDARGTERQKQVKALFRNWTSCLIIGHEHPDYPWHYYTPDFYHTLNQALVSPVIGDQRLHYETGIPSIRLYEIWHTSAIGLVDRRFNVEGLTDSFYFKDTDEFREKCRIIYSNPEVYEKMLGIQRKLLRKIKKKYANATYDWRTVLKKKAAAVKERHEHVRKLKDDKISNALKRLEALGINVPNKI